MTFATYWMQIQTPINRKLKNGLHLVEAEEWRKGWWRVRVPGAIRSTFVSPRVWGSNASIPYTGQPFGLAMQELHKLPTKEKKSGKCTSGVCVLRGEPTAESTGETAASSGSSSSSVRRQRAVRSTRGPKARKSYPKRRT